MNFEASLPAPQSLEQARVKLQQLTTSLQSLQYRVQSGAPLPPLPQIQSGLGVILTQLASLTETLAKSEDEIRAIVVFPNATFPVTTHEGLLTTLMRTKPLPEADGWIQQVRAEIGDGLTPVPEFKWSMNQDEDEEPIPGDEYNITEWLNIQKDKRQWTGFYTKMEMDDAFEIDRDDLDDIRKSRQVEADKSMQAMKEMLRYARNGR